MRSVQIWLSSDHRVYACDSDSGEVFWLPQPLHEPFPDAVKRAIAYHDAEVIADYMAWLEEGSGTREHYEHIGDAPRWLDGSYPPLKVYPVEEEVVP